MTSHSSHSELVAPTSTGAVLTGKVSAAPATPLQRAHAALELLQLRAAQPEDIGVDRAIVRLAARRLRGAQ